MNQKQKKRLTNLAAMNRPFDKWEIAISKTLEIVSESNKQNEFLNWGFESEVDFNKKYVVLKELEY